AVIPAFAVGRTQDMLLTLAAGKFDVWLDGMGKKVNNIYMDHPEYLRSAKKLREAMNRVRVVRSQRGGLQALAAAAVVTTRGMLGGGPILRYMQSVRA